MLFLNIFLLQTFAAKLTKIPVFIF